MSGNMYGNESRWQSEWERDDVSDSSSLYSNSTGAFGAPSEDAAQRLRKLFNQRLFTDVKFVISCGVKPKPEVLAHRAILGVGSPEFASMLFGNTVPDQQGRLLTSEYEIKNVSYEAFKNVVEYLYTDDVFFETDSLVMETLSAARKFQVNSLAVRCESYFESKEVSEHNVCSTLHLATTHKMDQLKNRCTQFIQDNTAAVLRSTDFRNATPSVVRAICKLTRLNLFSEQELFLGVLEWVEAQPGGGANKRSVIEPLLKNIRFLTMPCDQFRDLVQRCPDIFTAEEALNLVMYLSNPSQKKSNLPAWCNKGEKRCFRVDQSRGTDMHDRSRAISSDRKMTIALKPTRKEFLRNLTCMLELKCLEGRHKVKGVKLAFGDPVSERSVIGHMVINVSGIAGYNFNEHIRIENSKEIVVWFTKSLLAFEGQTVRISAEANEIKNYCFLQFDENRSFPEQSPFQCSLGSVPKENRLFFISEIIYVVVNRSKTVARGRPARGGFVYRGNRRQ